MSGSFQDFSSNPIIQSELASISQGRLTLTSNTPVLLGNVTGATAIYYTPYKGNQISIYDGNSWEVKTFSELTLSLSGLTANTIYDVFIYDNSGTLTLESVAWSNSGAGTSARASALTYLDGVRVKASDNRKYLGSFRCNSTGGQVDVVFEDVSTTSLKLFLRNEYNKITKFFRKVDDSSHTYTTDTLRNYRDSINNRLELLKIDDNEDFYLSLEGSITGLGIIRLGEVNTLTATDANIRLFSVGSGETGGRESFDWSETLSSGYHFYQIFQNGHTLNTAFNYTRLIGTYEY